MSSTVAQRNLETDQIVKNLSDWKLFLVELALDESFDFHERFGGVGTDGVNGQFAAGTGGEHHQTHDAFAIDLFAIFLHENIAGKPARGFDKHGRRPGMNARFVGDGEFLRQELTVDNAFGAHVSRPS